MYRNYGGSFIFWGAEKFKMRESISVKSINLVPRTHASHLIRVSIAVVFVIFAAEFMNTTANSTKNDSKTNFGNVKWLIKIIKFDKKWRKAFFLLIYFSIVSEEVSFSSFFAKFFSLSFIAVVFVEFNTTIVALLLKTFSTANLDTLFTCIQLWQDYHDQ